MQRVQRVVGPEATGASHGNPGGATNGAQSTSAGQHSFNEKGRIESGMNNAHTPNSGSTAGSTGNNAAQDRSHDGWSKFGSSGSHSGGDIGNGRSESSGNPRNSSGGVSWAGGNDRQMNGRQMSDHQTNSGMSQSSDHGAGSPGSRTLQKAADGRNFHPPLSIMLQPKTMAQRRITARPPTTTLAREFQPRTELTTQRKATLAETTGRRWICIGLS